MCQSYLYLLLCRKVYKCSCKMARVRRPMTVIFFGHLILDRSWKEQILETVFSLEIVGMPVCRI